MRGELDACGFTVDRQVVPPGVVAVASEYDEISGCTLRSTQQSRARRRIAVPAVEVVRQLQFGRDLRHLSALAHELRRIGGDPA